MRGQKNEKESNRKKEEKKISELKLDNKYNWTFWKMEEEKRQRWVQNTQKSNVTKEEGSEGMRKNRVRVRKKYKWRMLAKECDREVYF